MESPAPHGQPVRISVAVVQRGEQFLVGRRPAGVPLPGMAEFPGGKVHADESPERAAHRECLEETGLQVDVLHPLCVVQHHYDHGLLELHFFLCHCVADHQQPKSPFTWVSREQLANLEFPPANASLVAELTKKD